MGNTISAFWETPKNYFTPTDDGQDYVSVTRMGIELFQVNFGDSYLLFEQNSAPPNETPDQAIQRIVKICKEHNVYLVVGDNVRYIPRKLHIEGLGCVFSSSGNHAVNMADLLNALDNRLDPKTPETPVESNVGVGEKYGEIEFSFKF